MRFDLGVRGGGGGHVLDLETAVKDGILGGGGGDLSGGGGDGSNLDLKAMIEEVGESVEVPAVFICPISLEPMRDPVTLCTGQTYERSNILRWLSLGRLTCPTTMQELWDDSLTPNRTLLHLTSTWFSQRYSARKKQAEDVQGRAGALLESLRKAKGQARRVQALKDLRQVAAAHPAVFDAAGIALVSSLLGPFTSYAVGSEAIGILVHLALHPHSRRTLLQPAKVSLMVDLLNEGCIQTKLNSTKLIASLLSEEEEEKGNNGSGSASKVVWSLRLLAGLLRLVKDKRHPDGVLAALGLLHTVICSHESVRKSVAAAVGVVPQLVDLLPGLNSQCLELALPALESLSSVPEGAMALHACPNTIPNLVKLLMRVSENCTKFALMILWAICKLHPEESAPLALDAGLAAKLLLVIQSGCEPLLKQRSSELLKLCSLNSPSTIFISKCKLSRSMQ